MSYTISPAIGCGVAVGVAVAMVGWSSPAVAEPSESAQQLRTIDRLALEHNGSLEAYDARIRRSEYEAERETTGWPEPRLEYMGQLGAPWTPHGAMGHRIQVMQQIPLWGARDARAEPVRAERRVEQHRRTAAGADIFAELRADAVEIARIEARIELAEDEVGLLEDALGVVEATAPFEGGQHGDFFQLELAREQAADRIENLRADRQARLEAMAARIGMEIGHIEETRFASEILDDWRKDLPDRAELMEMVAREEPQLKAMESEAETAAAQIDLVDERTRPWPSVMVGYSNMPPMWEMDGPRAQMLHFGVGVALPIFGARYDLEASQWQQARRAVELDRRQRLRELRGDVEAVVVEWEHDRRRLQRHQREMLPLATDLAEQLIIGMELGERSASEFLLALRQEIEVEGRVIDLKAAQLQRQMRIQRLTGGAFGADEPWAYPEEFGGSR